jgi:peptide/nickel transport system substrate-binding protein
MTRPAFVLCVLACALLGAGVSGCRRTDPAVAENEPATFVFARGSDAQKLDPADVDDGESVNTLAQVLEGLVRFRSGTLEIEPALAESYHISEDGLTYTFHLRSGVRFHDGTPLDAAAAQWSFARQMDPGHPGHLPGASFQYWNYLYQEVAAVEAAGEMKLVFRLSAPNAALLRSLAIFPAYLVSPAALAAHGTEFPRRPVGTGPYRFVSWAPNQAIVLERNADYWDAAHAARFERLVFKVVPENTVRLLELRSGHVQGLDGLQPAELASVRADPRFIVHTAPGLNVGYLAFNLENPRFADPEVRAAIALALDREELRRVVLADTGTVARYPMPPGFLGEPAEPRFDLPHDPEQARALLAKHAALFRTPVRLHVMTAPRPFLPEPVQAASLIRGQLERVGVPVEIVARDFKTHLDTVRAGGHELALLGWIGDNGDTDNFLSIFFGSWAAEKGAATNISFYRNPEMDALLLAARRTIKPADRAALYERALSLWRRDLPLIPLLTGDQIVVLRREVTGFRLQPVGDLRLGGVGWETR